jgi:hypothetical protein
MFGNYLTLFNLSSLFSTGLSDTDGGEPFNERFIISSLPDSGKTAFCRVLFGCRPDSYLWRLQTHQKSAMRFVSFRGAKDCQPRAESSMQAFDVVSRCGLSSNLGAKILQTKSKRGIIATYRELSRLIATYRDLTRLIETYRDLSGIVIS